MFTDNKASFLDDLAQADNEYSDGLRQARLESRSRGEEENRVQALAAIHQEKTRRIFEKSSRADWSNS